MQISVWYRTQKLGRESHVEVADVVVVLAAELRIRSESNSTRSFELMGMASTR
jgi:hypothetical protein